MNLLFNQTGVTRSPLRSVLFTAISALLIVTGCAAVSPGTTTALPTTTTGGDGSITVEGVILTNGTVYISKAPTAGNLTHQLMTVQMPEKTEFVPGSLVEFVLMNEIRESYPLQTSGISSRVIRETTPVILAPIDLGPQLIGHMADDAWLIDVRTPEEFADGHIKDAINLPVDQIEKLIGSKVTDKNATLLIYCRSGNRSATAAKALKNLNYTLVFDLGGINSFKGEQVKGAN